MIRLCEVCFREITDDEQFETVHALWRGALDGEPIWRDLYVHAYDPTARRCAIRERADQRR